MIAFVAWLLMLSVAASGGEIYAAPQESETPEAALRTLIRANAEKDLSVLESHMAKDEDVVGYTTEAGSIWAGNSWPGRCKRSSIQSTAWRSVSPN